jgi:DNA polymerase-3 subunit gamma/tau
MDNSNVLALKYRPTKLTDLIGQDSVTTTLTNAFKDKDIYTCLVFAGNFGCGKTSAARILAAMENCADGPTLEPCGHCKMCRDIFAGDSIDVREVNAASHNGIDDIRNIADFVGSGPLLARTKYVIFDEVHALSRQAVESALKVLEEPPEGVRFVLCTTDLHKLKATIQTRCMPFRFTKVPWPQIAEHLKSIAALEKISVDDASLKIAAKLSDGSVRNSLRNLQLLKTYAGQKPITVDIAQQALGAIDDNNWFILMDAIIDRDATSGIKIIQELFSKGLDVAQILNGLTEHLRTMLLLGTVKNTSGLLYLSEEEKKQYVHRISRMSIYLVDLVIEMISLLQDVHRGITLNIHAQTLLEQFLIKSMIRRKQIEDEKTLK